MRWAAAAAAGALLLAGCSSDSEAGASGGDSNNVSEAVKQAVEESKAVSGFEAPGEAIDPSSLAGKKVLEIPSVPNPFLQSITDTMQGIADEVGLDYKVFESQGQVSQWVQGINQGIQDNVDLIVLNGAPDPRSLQPQLQEAEDAGIPVLVAHFHDDSTAQPPACEGCEFGVKGLVTAPFYTAGEAAANWIIADSGAAANTLIVGGSDILPSPGTIEAMTAVFDEECSDCEYKTINIPVADWNTKTQSEVQSALQSDPSINYVYLLYDAMVAGAVPAVETLGKGGSVKITSYNGSPFALDYIRDGDVVAMNVGEDTVGIGYAAMDQAFRLLLGKKPVETRTPIRVWDDSNVEEAGDPAEAGVGYGDAFADGYRELWGLK
ncbi:sugar ABC transporter substrate-binding protein [Nocardioides marmotae]|uniref:sugar ABC transporter substrate-binding protein n=1 Tax=Nocardioides marmotae TaxID=2663857 RepID=UPI001CA7DCC1|nr:sugar ABC transporter substrate-binding protein [Nocardioides marmotae]